MRSSVKDGFKLGGHELNFKPAKTVARTVKADFVHLTDYVEHSKNRKGADGAVVLEPRNFLTNPPKQGVVGKGTTLGGKIEYLPDPFDRKKDIEK